MSDPTEKVYYKMREPKELYRPLSLVKDPKTGLLKQQMPKKGGRKRFSKHFSKKCRKTRRKTYRKKTSSKKWHQPSHT